MRQGLRLPALIVAAGLLAGCSDPAGAVRRERAAHALTARPSAPPTRPATTPTPARPASWWQGPSLIKSAHGLRVQTGSLHAGRMRVMVTDLTSRTSRRFTATIAPRAGRIGRFTLTSARLVRSPRTHTYGLGFRYRVR
jgi:hypothetical protein